MHPTKQKKYTHNRMKACLLRSDCQNKENMPFKDELISKKFSVELPSKCTEQSEQHHKSILNQQISVTLNASNRKGNLFDKDIITLDIQTLNHLLGRNKWDTSLRQILQNSEAKSIEVRLLVERMLNCLSNDQRNNSSMISEHDQHRYVANQLSQTQMQPYIERQIDLLQKNLAKLRHEKDDYLAINALGTTNKSKMLTALKEMHDKQMRQLQELS